MSQFPSTPVIVIVGPTGSGKSELALEIAVQLGGEIVNCDSVQVYRGFEIGAAKTPVNQRRSVPHHLIDVLGPGQELTAGAYARLARPLIQDIEQRDRLPIVVGGTGFYLRALLDGLSPAPTRDSQLRKRLESIAVRRPAFLHRALRRYDRAAASRIHPNDVPKLIRAIEISRLTGKSATEAQEAPREGFTGVTVLKIGLAPDRKLLYAKLNERASWMFHNGLVEETQRLLTSGYARDSKPMQSLGYKQALEVIEGTCSFESALTECQAKTRQYAKRQTTWFRAEAGVHSLKSFGSEAPIIQSALELSKAFLEGRYIP
ncbi:MAG TPA: tRNA (adenosine(37)-N6)-dimethylallyltransferase MiaA [Bryobacteraceae bacterium]|nr:tRNA (adenosine(37)-N6)-dimethylallyltransferase MiaA [Bryobacteraceae bacterium]